jgi:hypothetical protein
MQCRVSKWKRALFNVSYTWKQRIRNVIFFIFSRHTTSVNGQLQTWASRSEDPFGTLIANCAFYSCSDAFLSAKSLLNASSLEKCLETRNSMHGVFPIFPVTPSVSTESSRHGHLGRKDPFGALIANCTLYSCSEASLSRKGHFSMLVIPRNKE